MKSLRLTTVTSMAVFCLLALQVQVIAQKLPKHDVASLINDRDEIVGFSETSAPKALVATTVSLSPTQLSFSYVKIDTTSSKTVTLTNVGTSSLSIYGIAITGINPGDFSQTHTCSTQLARGASCSITVKFRPTVSGTRTAALSIRDSGAGSPQIVPLAGTGVTLILSGHCVLNSSNQLTGGCMGNLGTLCIGSSGGTSCPAGSAAIKPGNAFCMQTLRNVPVDLARSCTVIKY